MNSRSLFLPKDHPRYKWVALSNTTLGMLMATINASIVLISLPAIFKGIDLDPLQAGNVSYLLWILMGYMLVTAVLVTSFGRLGDMFGRVRIYNLGFVVFTVGSIALSFDPFHGGHGAMWLIVWRIVQGVGGAMLFANSTAIITDAFPADRRGMALGINQVAAIAGSFIGLLVGGLLAVVDWRAVFWVSVPIGIIGTIWSYRSLHETGQKNPGRLDWAGNVTFALGLTALLTGITYGIQPYGGHSTGWTNPWVLSAIIGGLVLLVAFVFVELRVPAPMLDMRLFRIRAFSMGNLAGLLASIGRGGLQFMLIIWLQGIWLPRHGFNYEDTPLWAGIYLLPITIGFLLAGPLSGTLSDRFGARGFASGGLLLVAATFVALIFLPVNFEYWQFAIITLLSGIGSGMFGAPNRSAIMNAVPASERGAASGVAGTVQNAGSSLSIGVFFSLMVVGLASTLPDALRTGLTQHHVPAAVADQIAQLPPVGSLFAAFLGYNPIQSLLGSDTLSQLPQADQDALVGKGFFPQLISDAFHHGLVVVFSVAAAMSLVGAVASLFRGKRYVHDDGTRPEPVDAPHAGVEEGEGPSVAAAVPPAAEEAAVAARGAAGLGGDDPGMGGSPA
ncbi:MFS transporter [Luteimicrobium xylanilyticum]|uniref:Putative actinorhodin transporter n=1 Tax=Luteimicrobium xylanilyticum TaxID=1133546 RepID=A0A5P9QCK5_9MICO|nr:MFS transporter [Luteimicrobium xylanilyticum]QFU99183.1 putative actinorhodin transporter [Luteimicrobium xylanilyticum]